LVSHKSHVPGTNVLGIFEIHLASGLTEHTKLFSEKYVNRIGFQLHNRLITEKNQEHLRFIKNLVNDIGHNVIVPNMYFKLFFRRMKGKIDRTGAVSNEIRNKLDALKESLDNGLVQEVIPLAEELEYVNESMEELFQQILSHYEQTSLFLETLLRQSHFDKGRYVIEPKLVNFREKVIRPQLNRYLSRLQERNIAVDNQLSGIPDEEITVVVDVGLISQAYANLFSNAAKYTRGVHDEDDHLHKFIAVGMETLEGYFGIGKDGVKFNVFSTGPRIPPEDVPGLFDEGYRGKNVESEYGTGHGLQFIKEVVELHGGTAGYEPIKGGNNFYFILPK
jgi:signal transduction histidine kinase